MSDRPKIRTIKIKIYTINGVSCNAFEYVMDPPDLLNQAASLIAEAIWPSIKTMANVKMDPPIRRKLTRR
jgi:hypothetical protein